LTEDRVTALTKELQGMMAMVRKLYELDTTGLEPDLPFQARWD
jgi:Asp-tRNA(Asn)/Glu-tRNA(Gln) amidotransferase C subunit